VGPEPPAEGCIAPAGGGTIQRLIASLLLVVAFLQDPAGEEIRTLLRRLESGSSTPVETAEILLQLGQAVDQVAPGQARSLVGDAFRSERLPAARRLDLAETLIGLDDRATWTEEAERIALDDAEPVETRLRAALLMSRARAPRADEVGRTLDDRLFADGSDAAARALGAHLRGGPSPELQRYEMELLFRLSSPAARLALREALADDGVDALLRLEIAERLHAIQALDRVRDARAALEQVKARDPGLVRRVDKLLGALRGIHEDPAASAEPETGRPAAKGEKRKERSPRKTSKVNLILVIATVLAVGRLWKRR
jgi:hypothetical protein